MEQDLIFYDKFIKSRFRNLKEPNCIVSPLGTFAVFGLTFDACDENTKEFFNQLFNYHFNDDSYKILIKSLNLFDQKLLTSSKIFIRKDYQLQDDIKIILENNDCEIENVDINDSSSLNSIKYWVKEKTNDSFSELLDSPSLNNVTNFDFEWAKHFGEKNTTTQKFFLSDRDTLDVQMMNVEIECNYRDDENIDATIVELPCSDENLSMLFILPNKRTGITELENRLTQYDLRKTISKMKKHPVNVSLPKFKAEQTLDVRAALEQIGNEIATKPTFNFEKIVTRPSHMGRIMEKTLIEVSETGTKGTALNGYELLMHPIIKEMDIKTDISNRFATTLISKRVENIENCVQEATFSVILPENAFITEFVMEIEGKSYKSYVKEKGEAKHIYEGAVASGKSAAHVAVSARDSNKFTVSLNIRPKSEATFLLTYEELLPRIYNQYELVLNIHPGQLVDILKVTVKIQESRTLKYVKTPSIRSGNEINQNEEDNPFSEIEVSGSTGVVRFNPDLDQQKQLALKLVQSELKGIAGQFIVQYSVEIDPKGGEVLLKDGYFVHFYAPDDLPPLAKNVVFALDTSSSMCGRKIDQLKDAMISILSQIRRNDMVSILEFNQDVIVYDIYTQNSTVIVYDREENYYEPFQKLSRINLPSPKPADELIINKAKTVVQTMRAYGFTHMIGGIETALYLVKLGQEKYSNYQPLIIFLTDGEPTKGLENLEEIIKIVTKLNDENNKAPIFSLSFGEEADKAFLRKLSLKNFAFSRHIYEAADASLQLQQFYKQISSPLLSNITFKYDSEVESITRHNFPIYFEGCDIVVSGRYRETSIPDSVNCCCEGGRMILRPNVNRSITSLERLWAFLTLKQILDEREFAEDKAQLTKKALELALKYSFVTEVTSLVVVKPEDSSVVDTENASNANALVTPDALWDSDSSSASPVGSQPMSGGFLDLVSMTKYDADDILLDDVYTENEELETSEKLPEIDPTPKKFIADHPFIIILQYKMNDTKIILFTGRISKPIF